MKRSYVSIVTENYHYLVLWLVKSLRKYSVYDIHIFCINYHPKQNGLEIPDGVNFHRIDYDIFQDGIQFESGSHGNYYVNRKNPRIFQITSRKPSAAIMALRMGYDEVCFIDCDSVACPNIDEIFDHSHLINNIPLVTKGPHEFVIVPDEDGKERGNPFEGCWPEKDLTKTLEWPLMKFLQVGLEKRGEYRTGNLFLANKSCLEFLSTFEEFLNVLWKVVDVYYYCPFQEETLLNVLIWKHEGQGLPMSYINLDEGFESVRKFFEIQVSQDTFISDFLKIPPNKKQIKVLHGEKREQELEKIIQHLDFLKDKGYFESRL
jgi:hypothetical protein